MTKKDSWEEQTKKIAKEAGRTLCKIGKQARQVVEDAHKEFQTLQDALDNLINLERTKPEATEIKNGLKFSTTVKYNIEILKLDPQKPIPKDQEGEFLEWLEHKAVELGHGNHYEYFSYAEDFKDDIPVAFRVSYA